MRKVIALIISFLLLLLFSCEKSNTPIGIEQTCDNQKTSKEDKDQDNLEIETIIKTIERPVINKWTSDSCTDEISIEPKWIIKIGDYLYFTKVAKKEKGYQCQIWRLKEDGSEENIVYEYFSYFPGSKLLQIGDEMLLFNIGIDARYLAEPSYASLNLISKEIEIYEVFDIGLLKYYNNSFFFLSFQSGREGSLCKSDINFNLTPMKEGILDYLIYNKIIIYLSKDSSSSTISLKSCDLDGRNSELLYQLESSGFISLNEGILYSSSKDGTLVINLLTGIVEKKDINIFPNESQYLPDYFIAHDMYGKNIYRISYDWQRIEVIAEYYCSIQAIGDYIYLIPDLNYDEFYDDFNEYGIVGGIYRIKHDGSFFEKFVSTTINYN